MHRVLTMSKLFRCIISFKAQYLSYTEIKIDLSRTVAASYREAR